MTKQSEFLLNEHELAKVSESKRATYIYKWLSKLYDLLGETQKDDIKDIQKTLVDQLMGQLMKTTHHPARKLIAKCLSTMFTIGDTFLLFDTVNKCVDILKNKDDSTSAMNIKISAIVCIGIMYENLGRLMGRTYEDTITLLLKQLKSGDSSIRFEIYSTLKMVVCGMGTAVGSAYRNIYKSLKHGMVDRNMLVRASAARCMHQLILNSPFLYTAEIENVFSLCFRSLDGSNYEVRCAVSQALGSLVAITQDVKIRHQLQNQTNSNLSSKARMFSLDEVLSFLSTGYLRGGIGFLKAGEMIKGGSTINREVRIGVSHAYVKFVNQMGTNWTEKNFTIFMNHLFEVLVNPKSSSTHLDAIYSRKCISFILRSVTKKILTEKGQFQAVKELTRIVSLYSKVGNASLPRPANSKMNELTSNPDDLSSTNLLTNDIQMAQHVLVVALIELGTLIVQLGPSFQSILSDSQLELVESVSLNIYHPSHIVRLSTAWCLRCFCSSVNGQLTPLFEKSLERIETLRSNSESINGHSYVLSALLGTVKYSQLGIPQNKGKIVFNIAEDLLRTANQNSRLSLPRTQAGWQLMGSLMALGPSVVKGLLPRLLLLWKNSFPRNTKELDMEKNRGDAFTWQITLENRAGALAAMASFFNFCPKLVTDDIRRRLLTPIESAIQMLVSLNTLFKSFGISIKASYTTVRLRLYQVLLLLPPQLYENCFVNLLRLVVADLTLTDNASNTTTSNLKSLIQTNSDIILGSWLEETDHQLVEDHMQNYLFSGVGSIEYDPTILYKSSTEFVHPFPPSLAVSIINKSSQVFALVFPYIAQKHKVQMLNHFEECMKQAKSSRQESICINVMTAILGALKTLAESKMALGTEEVRKLVVGHIFRSLGSSNALIRYAAAESLGRCVQTVNNDSKFVTDISQQCFDKLRTARDAITRTGYSLAIGFIHHYVVGMGSTQQLKSNISLLLALAEDHSSASVQIWALQSITLIAESGGPMFRPYVEPTLDQCMKILFALPPSLIDVHQSIGKCISAMITTIGPEFLSESSAIDNIRYNILIACRVMQEHGDFLIQSESICCWQQLHMFDKKNIDLSKLIHPLSDAATNCHSILRRSSILCLHQISQKDPGPFLKYGSAWVEENKNQSKVGIINNFNLRVANGYPGILASLFDFETDSFNNSNIKKILFCLVQSADESNLGLWLSLCKEVLSASDDVSNSNLDQENEQEEGDFEESGFKTEKNVTIKILYRWQTRVLITNILSKLITHCYQSKQSNVHFDLALAQQQHAKSGGTQDYLVLHLSHLVRMSFISATSDCDDLRIEGLKVLELVIEHFAKVPEPEYPDHVVLEQFQAQVGAALRPAFGVDTPSHITALACQVCSAWIGSGVARDLNDLRRVHQLLVSSLDKLHRNSTSKVYNESASTMEKLAILKAWAEVYVVAITQHRHQVNTSTVDADDPEVVKENLLQLVSPELVTLSKYWLLALKDHALLTLPSEYISQIPPDGGTFFIMDTMEIVRPMYRTSWPYILHAAALWLCSGNGFELLENDESINMNNLEKFYLLFGICMEALSNPKSTEQSSSVSTYLYSLRELVVCNSVTIQVITDNDQLFLELCKILHRLLLTHEVSDCQMVIADIIQSIVDIQLSHLQMAKAKLVEEESEDCLELQSLGEGGSSGEILASNSLVYSLLEICMTILVRQMPELSPNLASTPEFSFIRNQSKPSTSYILFNSDNCKLIAKVLTILVRMPNLCSGQGSVTILPTVLHLLTGVFCQISVVSQTVYDEKLYDKEPMKTLFKCIQSLCTNDFVVQSSSAVRDKWIQLLQSSLARILDMSKTSDDHQKQDFISTLLAIGVFVIHAPTQVLSTPQLQYPIINLMTQAMQSDKDLVQLNCIETLKLIYTQGKAGYTFYIHSLAPKMIQVLCTLINQVKSGQDVTKCKVDSILAILTSLEVLIDKAEDEEKRSSILFIYISSLVSVLNVQDSSSQVATNVRLQSNSHALRMHLHEQVLTKLTDIGLKYSEQFKKIIANNPGYGETLRISIQNQHKMKENGNSSKANQNSSAAKSTIQLKVDFSNYK